MELYEPQQIEHAVINGRNVWTWLFQTTLGEYYLTQYEEKGPDPWINDAYIGRSQNKAAATFKKAVKKLLA